MPTAPSPVTTHCCNHGKLSVVAGMPMIAVAAGSCDSLPYTRGGERLTLSDCVAGAEAMAGGWDGRCDERSGVRRRKLGATVAAGDCRGARIINLASSAPSSYSTHNTTLPPVHHAVPWSVARAGRTHLFSGSVSASLSLTGCLSLHQCHPRDALRCLCT